MFQSSRATSLPVTAGNPPSIINEIQDYRGQTLSLKNVPIIFQYIKPTKIVDQLCLYNAYLTNETRTMEI